MSEGFDIPRVGDIWVYDEDDGTIVECAVTAVEPPDQPWDDWRVGFDGHGGLRHRGWWYGQGWSEKEDD